MEEQYNEALEANLAASRLALGFVAAAAAATVAMAVAAPLALAARILACTWIACAALHALHRAGRARHIALDADGTVRVDGTAGALRAGSFVAPWLTVVRWRPAGAAFDRTVLVLPDMLPPDRFRRLRVILRWATPKPGADPVFRHSLYRGPGDDDRSRPTP
ncbi:MAG TPA: protein YgfX [Myxococcota bacterium]|nr:protein YgfX [Myxococcota bacterium]